MLTLLITDEHDESSLGDSLKEMLLSKINESNIEYKHFGVKDDDVRNCLGCFSCWTKTNGKCVIGDTGNLICDCYMQSEYAVVLSPVKYGCYSTAIKKVLDRITPNNQPFLTRYRNRTRHKARYEKYPQFVVVGYGEDMSETEERTFISIANANAVNFQKDDAKVYLCRKCDDIEGITEQILEFIGVKEVTA